MDQTETLNPVQMSQRPSEIKKRGKNQREGQHSLTVSLEGSEHFIRRGCWNKPQEELGQGRVGKNSHDLLASGHSLRWSFHKHLAQTQRPSPSQMRKLKRRCRFILQLCGLSFSQLFMVYRMTWGNIWAGRMPPSIGVISLVWNLVSLAWTTTTHWSVRCTFYVCPVYCHQL